MSFKQSKITDFLKNPNPKKKLKTENITEKEGLEKQLKTWVKKKRYTD